MVPIYRSDGEWVAVYVNGYLLNVEGEWIGFVVGREVYDPGGVYLGFLSDDKRLLRKRSLDREPPRRQPPPPPERVVLPPVMPLAPLFRGLPYQIIDVFETFGDKLLFVSETRSDMD
jgi:hypothetical protein